MRLLLFSNSTNAGEEYMTYPLPAIKDFMQGFEGKALFIPFAGVSTTWDDYYNTVNQRFESLGIRLESIHHSKDYLKAVQDADAIVVGGGNTFNLLKTVQENKLVEAIQEKIKNGTPYIGWSAGSNLTCPTIRTTNDMPIVEPQSFNALQLIPFQINPHYLDANPDGHAGETREMRIEEFLIANPNMFVAGLREGCWFKIEGGLIAMEGKRSCRIFKNGQSPKELGSTDDFSFLLKQ